MAVKNSIEIWKDKKAIEKKVFVARNDKGKLITWSPVYKKRYSNLKEFKKSVQNQRFRFSEQVEENLDTEVNVGANIIEAKTNRFVPDKNNRYRVLASVRIDGTQYSAISGLVKNSYNTEDMEDAKDQALYSLATQVIRVKKGFGTTNKDFIDENQEDIEEAVQSLNSDVKYQFIYIYEFPKQRQSKRYRG